MSCLLRFEFQILKDRYNAFETNADLTGKKNFHQIIVESYVKLIHMYRLLIEFFQKKRENLSQYKISATLTLDNY